MKTDFVQNSLTNGEISPSAYGRWDLAKYQSSVKKMENWLGKQLGGASYRPGTRFVYETKTSSLRSRLLKFQYSTEQSYVIEEGNLYFRYYVTGANAGVLLDPTNPVETVTVFLTADIPSLKYAQNADTQYIASGTYIPYKHQRTTATTFTMTAVVFKRGPFLDDNLTSTTITASADTGAGITLTASSAIFTTGASGHTGSFWKIKDGYVKITATASTTSATATVQAVPDGTAGNLGTSGAAQTDWAEGSWSAVRGYPKAVTFHDGRLYFAGTRYQPGGVWGSVPFEYENFDAGTANDDDSVSYELNADTAISIRWLSSSPKGLICGTNGGTFNLNSGAAGQPISPSNINAPRENLFGTADIQGKRMFNYAYFIQNNSKRLLESGYFFEIDSTDAVDTTKLADHILDVQPSEDNIFLRGDTSSGGAYDMDTQQSPHNRVWVVRNDGQIVILTRNVREEVNGWCTTTAGKTVSCDGKSGTGQFESIAIMGQEGSPDQIWVIANRRINGTVKRFVEYFTEEDFKYDWDAVRLDCSLTLDEPIDITAITLASPIVITAPAHGFINGQRVRLDNIVGTHQLNGQEFIIGLVTTNTFAIYDTED